VVVGENANNGGKQPKRRFNSASKTSHSSKTEENDQYGYKPVINSFSETLACKGFQRIGNYFFQKDFVGKSIFLSLHSLSGNALGILVLFLIS